MAPDTREAMSPTSPASPAFHDAPEGQKEEEPVSPGAQKHQLSPEASRSVQNHTTPQDLAALHSLDDQRDTASSRHDTPLSDPEKDVHPEHNFSSDSSHNSQVKQGDPADPDNPHSQVPTLEGLSEDMSRPPPLNYTLRTRKLAIIIFWTLILVDSIGIPVILYFCLHYLPSDPKKRLSPNAVFSISTGCLGGISIFEYFLRFWRLWKKGSTCRVIGARRWYLDWFHWNYSIAWVFIMIELIAGTIPEFPPIRLLAMPVSSLLFWFAFELLAIDTFRFLNIPAPIRISSVPKGAPMRPAIYSIIEDVCSVDGSGGTEFRKRLNARYVASHYFRQMLHRLTIFWAFGGLFNAIVTTGLVFGLENGEISYVIGWALPFVWSGFMIPPTFWYVRRCLRREYAKWPERRMSVV